MIELILAILLGISLAFNGVVGYMYFSGYTQNQTIINETKVDTTVNTIQWQAQSTMISEGKIQKGYTLALTNLATNNLLPFYYGLSDFQKANHVRITESGGFLLIQYPEMKKKILSNSYSNFVSNVTQTNYRQGRR